VDDSSARAAEFDSFLLEIMERAPNIELASIPRSLFDLQAWRDGGALHVITMVTTPQTYARLNILAKRLDEWIKLSQSLALARSFALGHDRTYVLAVPGLLPRSKMTDAIWSRVEVWDGPYLHDWASQLSVPVPPFITAGDLNESPMRGADYERAIEHRLLRQLAQIAPGEENWIKYEKFCEDLLDFLFVPPLNSAIAQRVDNQGANRRDYILPNYSSEGFWAFIRQHYAAHFVVAEVKNLRNPPGKAEILQVANYLNKHGTGLFALLLARKLLTPNGNWVRREQWISHDKLIIDLDDADVKQMIRIKLAGGDPAELVRQRIEDFRLGI
jgi:hypothetical protein